MREGTAAEVMIGRSVYGEIVQTPRRTTYAERLFKCAIGAGVVTSDDYDFKGNLLRSQRQLAHDYKTTLDWSSAVPLEVETFTSRTTYDALNRPTDRHHAGRQHLSPDLQRRQSARQGGREPARRGCRNLLRHQHRLQRQRTARTDRLRQWRADHLRIRPARPSA